jgi:hypothetical protein
MRIKNKRLGLVAAATLLVALSVLFPLHITVEPQPVGQPVYRVTIGTSALAHDADSTCDGTDDHVEIQALLDLLPAAVGGRIEIEAGYYSWGTGETVTRNISNVTIIGVGGLVSFDGDDTTPLFEAGGDNWLFENIVTDAGGIDTGVTSGYVIRNVLIDTTYYAYVTDSIDIEDHSARHESGGADAIKLDDLATPDDNTDLDATTGYHGLLPKLTGNVSVFLSGQGTWIAPAGSGEGDMLKSTYDTDEDDLIDTAAGGTEWDSSAVTGVAYITTGSWSNRPIGIEDTNILIVSGSVASTEHCRFTADGIEGLSSAELLAAISGEAGASFDWNGQDLTNVGDVDGRDVSADGTKLDGIEAGADVTDAANVDSAGAVMESDYDADTFLYATLDDTPAATSPANVLAALGGHAGAAFDWNAQELKNWQVENGATVPVSPATDQLFLHTPTGRNVLMYYDDSDWYPIQSYGGMTIYVDNTDGTDGINYGTGVDSNAFQTIQYAVDQIPANYGGDVTININGETYSGSIDIKGKSPTGDYSITLQGQLSEQESPATDATVTAGSGATQGTVTHADFNGDDYSNMLCYFEDDDEYRVIDSHATTTLTMVSDCPSATDQEVIIYDWDTVISGDFDVEEDQKGVYVYDIEFDKNIDVYLFSSLWLDRCHVAQVNAYGALLTMESCRLYYSGSGYGATLWVGSTGYLSRSKFEGTHTSTHIVLATANSILMMGRTALAVTDGCVVDGTAGVDKANYGVRTSHNGGINFYTSVHNQVRDCDTGVYAQMGGSAILTAYVAYSGNGVDEGADAASFGYVD